MTDLDIILRSPGADADDMLGFAQVFLRDYPDRPVGVENLVIFGLPGRKSWLVWRTARAVIVRPNVARAKDRR